METKHIYSIFFEEKEIPFKLFKIRDKTNTVHFNDTEVVIESIMSTCEEGQR